MKILGKSLSKKFLKFYEEVKPRLGVQIKFEVIRPSRLGYLFGALKIENSITRIMLRSDLPRLAFEHTLAHELVHVLQIKEGWPEGRK